jgi:NADH-ubiquinone oxidoreductase chain 5
LCGFPFLAGFYSKDLIMESAINISNRAFILLLALFRLRLTSFYSIRFRLVTIWSTINGAPLINITEYKAITTPIILLTIISISAGGALRWIPHVRQSLFILPTLYKLSPIIIVILGFLAGWYITNLTSTNKSLSIQYTMSHYGSCLIWYLVPLSSQFIIKFPILTAHQYIKSTDQGWLELASANGIHSLLATYRNSVIYISPKSPTSYLVTSSSITLLILFTIYIYFSCLSSLNLKHITEDDQMAILPLNKLHQFINVCSVNNT